MLRPCHLAAREASSQLHCFEDLTCIILAWDRPQGQVQGLSEGMFWHQEEHGRHGSSCAFFWVYPLAALHARFHAEGTHGRGPKPPEDTMALFKLFPCDVGPAPCPPATPASLRPKGAAVSRVTFSSCGMPEVFDNPRKKCAGDVAGPKAVVGAWSVPNFGKGDENQDSALRSGS